MSGRRLLERLAVGEELTRHGCSALCPRPTRNHEPRRMMGIAANRESEAGHATKRLTEVGRVIMRHGIRRADQARVPMRRLGQEVGRGGSAPTGFLSTDGGRPHEIENGDEAYQDVERAGAFDFVADERAGQIDGYEQVLSNDEVRSRVDAGDSAGTVEDAAKNTASVDLACSP